MKREQQAKACENCGKKPRLKDYRYCNLCLQYIRRPVINWSRKQNPIPGEDMREC